MRTRLMFILGIIFAYSSLAFAQGQKYSILENRQISELPSKLPPALIKIDNNGDTISVIKIISPLENLTFSGNVFGEPKIEKKHNRLFIMSLLLKIADD